MLFNSLHFLIFLPIVIGIYFSLKHKHRWIVLLVASYYFYMSWKAEYILLIMLSTIVDYISGLQIYASKSLLRKKIFLGLSLTVNLGLLFLFKYFNFFSENVVRFMNSISIPMDPITVKVLLPVGISFYTFQTLSYTIDVFKGKMKPEKHLGVFAVYVSFFPQLVAGPIERARNLLPQFFIKHSFDKERLFSGMSLILWGFFKKVVIADRLSVVVNQVYNNSGEYSGIPLIIATIFFAYQIYCDFSGYSDIAIGTARIMGFNLMTNFRRPYFAKSIAEFWRRWHISLSTWFRDYVYIPLGGNRVSIPRNYFNLFITFFVSGIWHGANWTFIVWGALHGWYIVFAKMTEKTRNKFNYFIGLTKNKTLHNLIRLMITFILVNISWIFFRANNLSEAIYVLKNLFKGLNLNFTGANIGLDWTGFFIAIGSILLMEIIHLFQEKNISWSSFKWSLKRKSFLIMASHLMLILIIIVFGVYNSTEFIYFQF